MARKRRFAAPVSAALSLPRLRVRAGWAQSAPDQNAASVQNGGLPSVTYALERDIRFRLTPVDNNLPLGAKG